MLAGQGEAGKHISPGTPVFCLRKTVLPFITA
jgi:hypothetical protein